MEQLNRMKRARRTTKRRGTVGGTEGKLEKGKALKERKEKGKRRKDWNGVKWSGSGKGGKNWIRLESSGQERQGNAKWI